MSLIVVTHAVDVCVIWVSSIVVIHAVDVCVIWVSSIVVIHAVDVCVIWVSSIAVIHAKQFVQTRLPLLRYVSDFMVFATESID